MINLWKLIKEPKVLVEKICNECGKVIETFDSTHPLTQYLIFDLRADIPGKVNLDTLDFGLQPYHWCPIKPNGNACLVPLQTTRREEEQKEAEALKASLKLPPPPPPSLGGHAPYHPANKKKTGVPGYSTQKGRPPKTAYETIKRLSLEEQEKKEEKEKQDDSANSV